MKQKYLDPAAALGDALTVTDFNRVAGTGSNAPFSRMQQQVRALRTDVQQLVGSFQQLNRATATSSGGGLVQGQVAGMRQLVGLQQQVLRNQTQLNAGGGGGRGPALPGGGWSWGRPARIADRVQHRAVGDAAGNAVGSALRA